MPTLTISKKAWRSRKKSQIAIDLSNCARHLRGKRVIWDQAQPHYFIVILGLFRQSETALGGAENVNFCPGSFCPEFLDALGRSALDLAYKEAGIFAMNSGVSR
jgi:hypothetical protein